MRRKLAAGNWKMNGLSGQLAELDKLAAAHPNPTVDVLLCPPATLLAAAAQSPFSIGAQDCHANASGAHTGDISAEMLKDVGAQAIIVGHSERRADHDEHSDIVRAKARAAQTAGLMAVVCMGESLAEREAQNTLDIIGGQLAGSIPDNATAENLVVAYEPIWHEGAVVGFCTSGGYSHYAGKSIAMGLIPCEMAREGLQVEIEVLGDMRPASLITTPLFDADGARMRG